MVNQQDGISPQTPLLRMHHISFGYHQHALLYDVSLTITRGEMLGLLGPNGSGKTTLLRLLSGTLRPQQGQVELEGRALAQWGRRQVARRVAVVPQELHMPFAFTVEQMVALGRTPFDTSFWRTRSADDHEIVHDALTATGIASLSNHIFNELSGGERQRVMIAMALAQQPSVLLLDEPTSHLDIKYQVETLELVQQLNRERCMTIVAAMHDLNLAARYFPRLLLFQRGVVADASPAEVLEPALLGRVYGVAVQVGILRGAEHLSVLPPAHNTASPLIEHQPYPRIHVIAGGGSGELAMRALADAHLPFVAGALNIGDSDHTLALRLAQEVITEQPYAPISPQVASQVRASLQKVSLLLICPTAIGPGNLVLFTEALRAAQNGLPVFLLNTAKSTVCAPDDEQSSSHASDFSISAYPDSIGYPDYTGGRGQELGRQLVAQETTCCVSSISTALEEIKKRVAGAYVEKE